MAYIGCKMCTKALHLKDRTYRKTDSLLISVSPLNKGLKMSRLAISSTLKACTSETHKFQN